MTLTHVSKVYNRFNYSKDDIKNHLYHRALCSGSEVFSVKREYQVIKNRVKKYNGKVISFEEFEPLFRAGFTHYVNVWSDLGYDMSGCVLK